MAYNTSRGGRLLFSEFNELKDRINSVLDDSANNLITVGYGYPRVDPRGPVYKTVTTGTAGQPYIAPSGPIYGAGTWNMSQSTPPTNYPRGQIYLWSDGAGVPGTPNWGSDIGAAFRGRNFSLVEILNPSNGDKSQQFIDAALNNVGTGPSSPTVSSYAGYMPFVPISYRPANWLNSFPSNPAEGDTVVQGGTRYDYKLFYANSHIGNTVIMAPRLYTYSRPIIGYTNPGQPFIANTLRTETVLDYYQFPNAGVMASRGRLVTYTDWANLRSEVNMAYKHQFGADLTDNQVPVLSRGARVTKDAHDKLNTILTTVESTPLRVHTNSLGLFTLGAGTRATTWGTSASSIKSIETVTFANTNAARYFFNSGGTIRISFSHTKVASTPQDMDWWEMTNRMGTISVGATSITQSGNTGMAIATGLGGWYSLSNSELTVLNAVNAGGVYQGTYAGAAAYLAAYRVNDAKVTVGRTIPANASSPISLIISTTFTDDHTSPWYDRVAAGTKVTVQASKAVNPLTNIATPTFSSTNFTSSPTTATSFARMMFANPTEIGVTVEHLRKFKISYSPTNAVVNNTGEFSISVPGEVIEYVEITPVAQEPDSRIKAVGITHTDDFTLVEYQSLGLNHSICKVRVRIKTFTRSSWLVIDYLALDELASYDLMARISSDPITSTTGYPVDISIDGNSVVMSTRDRGAVDMVSIDTPSDDSISGLVPPRIVSSEVAESGRTLTVDMADTAAIGNVEFASHRAMMEIPNVYFANQGETPYFANSVEKKLLKVTTVNNIVNGIIYGKLYIDQSSFTNMYLVSVIGPMAARSTDGNVQVSSSSLDPLTGKWCVSYVIQPESKCSFVNIRVGDERDSYLFRDVAVRNSIGIEVSGDIYTEDNEYSVNSTVESPVFTLVTNVTASGSGLLSIREATSSFSIDDISIVPSSRLAGSAPTKTVWADEGDVDGVYSVKFQAKNTQLCDLRATVGAAVYWLFDVNLAVSATQEYLGALDHNPETIQISSDSNVSVYGDYVKIILSISAEGKRVTAFKRDVSQWSAGWEPAEAPLFNDYGSSNSNDSFTKEITIPLSQWTITSSKMLFLEVKFDDGLYCTVDVDIMQPRYVTTVDLIQSYN